MIVWYARGGGILRSGPYPSLVEAVKAMRLVRRPDDAPNAPPRYPPDVFVWPEETER